MTIQPGEFWVADIPFTSGSGLAMSGNYGRQLNQAERAVRVGHRQRHDPAGVQSGTERFFDQHGSISAYSVIRGGKDTGNR